MDSDKKMKTLQGVRELKRVRLPSALFLFGDLVLFFLPRHSSLPSPVGERLGVRGEIRGQEEIGGTIEGTACIALGTTKD